MKTFFRIRLEGARAVEFSPEDIKSFRVDELEDGDYYLGCSYNGENECILHIGTFDSCHTILNKIHSLLDAHIIDI